MHSTNQEEDQTMSKVQVVKSMIQLGVPVIFQAFMSFLNQTVNIFYSGYDPDPSVVAGVGLGTTFINVVYLAVCLGLNGVLQSLISQSIGAGNYRQSGIYVNRGRLIITIWCPIAIFLSFFLEDTLIAIGIDSQTAKCAQNYTVRQIPGLIAFMYFDIARQFLVGYGKPLLSTYIQVITGILHIFLCHFLIVKMELPYYYTSYSTCLQFFANFVIIHFLIKLDSQYNESWFLGGMETFSNFCEYAKLAVPAALLFCMEFLGFEALCIVSGYISVTANAAQVITFTTNVMFYMIPTGLSMASTTIVGQLIGQKNSKLAKAKSSFIIKFSLLLALFMGGLLFVLRHQIAKLFSTNPEVVEITSQTFIVSAISVVFDFIYAIQQGSIRALTKFNHAVAGGIVAFYVFAWPLGTLLGIYFKLGLKGLWMGLITGEAIVVLYFQYLLSWGFDWEKITQQCSDRQDADLKIINQRENLLMNSFDKVIDKDDEIIEMQGNTYILESPDKAKLIQNK
ncbi:na+-driven multidrug efflux pump [Stylonychia lemnae]|uniref:Na+-driven multidrug efflux pump n=1 Tax=Stylonychia lemnae TaxID=5949 RepID=A0A078B1W1_STYLE|nr:na+-driven multidrug efflux pump [Stylonychia lemnae]|eukprot:CDW88276.1 na+-driven multidrug efflux pump [Stylonychia lemnae]